MYEDLRNEIVEKAGFPNPQNTRFDVKDAGDFKRVTVFFNPGGTPWRRVIGVGESEEAALRSLIEYVETERGNYENLCAKAKDPDAIWA